MIQNIVVLGLSPVAGYGKSICGDSLPYLDWVGKWPAVDEDYGYEKYSQEILAEKPVSPFKLSTIFDELGGGASC